MNAKRRKALLSIIAKLENMDAMREEIREHLQNVMDEEQEAVDNMPDSLQNSVRGQNMLENIDEMQDVIGELTLMNFANLQQQLSEMCPQCP